MNEIDQRQIHSLNGFTRRSSAYAELVTVDKQEGIHVLCDSSAEYEPGASGVTVTWLAL